MLDYAICELGGKQYKFTPNNPIKVDFLDSDKAIDVAVLVLSEKGDVRIGKPYLKEKLTLNFLENVKEDKIRVAKFHAKANFRKVTGHKARKTKLVWPVKKP